MDGSAEALGRSQGGFSTKLHLRAEGGGKPITAVLAAGERHEQLALPALLDTGAVPRKGRGRPRLRPRRVVGDKGYSSPTASKRLRARRIRPVIPTRKGDKRQPAFDKAAYRERDRVERLINRLKQFRRIATRYEEGPPTTSHGPPRRDRALVAEVCRYGLAMHSRRSVMGYPKWID